MGKSTKKSSSKVEADVIVAAPIKPLKKGKREAEEAIKKPVVSAKKQKVEEKKIEEKIVKKKVETSSSDDTSSSDSEQPKPSETVKSSSQAATEDSSSEEESSDDDKPSKMQGVTKSTTVSNKSSSSEDSSDDDEESSEEEKEQTSKTPKKNDTDVKMTDVSNTKPKTPANSKGQTTGTKRLFVGNLSFSVEEADVKNFLEAAGEIVDVHLAMQDDSFKGYGHVEFASAEEAEKALRELNGKDLMGRAVRLDLARERASSTPYSGGRDSQSFQKGGSDQGQTLFVRGFNKYDVEDDIRSNLKDHFGSCGEITKVSIPTDQEGSVKGIAYINFTDNEALKKALELNGSELGGCSLYVDEATPRSDNRDSAGGGRGGGRSGGRDSGGRFGSGRRGGGRGGGGRFSGGGRGRGTPNRSSFASAGKKTTFSNND